MYVVKLIMYIYSTFYYTTNYIKKIIPWVTIPVSVRTMYAHGTSNYIIVSHIVMLGVTTSHVLLPRVTIPTVH